MYNLKVTSESILKVTSESNYYNSIPSRVQIFFIAPFSGIGLGSFVRIFSGLSDSKINLDPNMILKAKVTHIDKVINVTLSVLAYVIKVRDSLNTD